MSILLTAASNAASKNALSNNPNTAMGRPFDFRQINGESFGLYDVSTNPDIAARLRLNRSPGPYWIDRLYCQPKIWPFLTQPENNARAVHLREAIFDLIDQVGYRHEERAVVSESGKTFIIRTPGAHTGLWLTFSQSEKISTDDLAKILGGEVFDLRTGREQSRRGKKSVHYAGHFHVFSWIIENEWPVEKPDDHKGGSKDPRKLSREHEITTMPPHLAGLARKSDAEFPKQRLQDREPFICPVKLEWSGTYVGDLSHIFDLGKFVADEAEKEGENTEGNADGGGSMTKAMNRMEAFGRNLVDRFWNRFASSIDDPFVNYQYRFIRQVNPDWWSVMQKRRDGELTLLSRRIFDDAENHDQKQQIAEMTEIFEALAILTEEAHSRYPEGVRQQLANDWPGALFLMAGFAGSPAGGRFTKTGGVVSFMKICNHIVHTFNPAGWQSGNTLRSNRYSGFGVEPYCVASHTFGKPASAHQGMASQKLLRRFLAQDRGLSEDEIEELIAQLASTEYEPHELTEVGCMIEKEID